MPGTLALTDLDDRDAAVPACMFTETSAKQLKGRKRELLATYQPGDMRRWVEEAGAARDFTSTRSLLHNAIISAAQAGRLHGGIGRLGDLASVDGGFDTAVTAAAGNA